MAFMYSFSSLISHSSALKYKTIFTHSFTGGRSNHHSFPHLHIDETATGSNLGFSILPKESRDWTTNLPVSGEPALTPWATVDQDDCVLPFTKKAEAGARSFFCMGCLLLWRDSEYCLTLWSTESRTRAVTSYKERVGISVRDGFFHDTPSNLTLLISCLWSVSIIRWTVNWDKCEYPTNEKNKKLSSFIMCIFPVIPKT